MFFYATMQNSWRFSIAAKGNWISKKNVSSRLVHYNAFLMARPLVELPQACHPVVRGLWPEVRSPAAKGTFQHRGNGAKSQSIVSNIAEFS